MAKKCTALACFMGRKDGVFFPPYYARSGEESLHNQYNARSHAHAAATPQSWPSLFPTPGLNKRCPQRQRCCTGLVHRDHAQTNVRVHGNTGARGHGRKHSLMSARNRQTLHDDDDKSAVDHPSLTTFSDGAGQPLGCTPAHTRCLKNGAVVVCTPSYPVTSEPSPTARP